MHIVTVGRHEDLVVKRLARVRNERVDTKVARLGWNRKREDLGDDACNWRAAHPYAIGSDTEPSPTGGIDSLHCGAVHVPCLEQA